MKKRFERKVKNTVAGRARTGPKFPDCQTTAESTTTGVHMATHVRAHTHTPPDESMTSGFQIKKMETLIHNEQIEQCAKFGPSLFVSDYV